MRNPLISRAIISSFEHLRVVIGLTSIVLPTLIIRFPRDHYQTFLHLDPKVAKIPHDRPH